MYLITYIYHIDDYFGNANLVVNITLKIDKIFKCGFFFFGGGVFPWAIFPSQEFLILSALTFDQTDKTYVGLQLHHLVRVQCTNFLTFVTSYSDQSENTY